MLFSIIVPVYNTGQTLRNCLDSILQQTFRDYKVILINDGSTDESPSICLEYASYYHHVKTYTFENGGVSVARKRGIILSSGKYLIFVDSDDTINNHLLENIANVISSHPNLDLVRYQCNLINDDDHKNHERYNFHSNTDCLISGLEALRLWSAPDIKYAVYWLFAFKRSLFSNICLMPNIKCYEDVAYIPVIIASSKIVITINYHGYNYLCNRHGSLTNTIDENLQRQKAYDFYHACMFAMSYFLRSDMPTQDISFFILDYTRRLRDFFYSTDIELRKELAPIYLLPIERD